MLKKTVTYTDFNDNEVSEDLYFNLTTIELAEMNLDGKFSDKLQHVMTSEDTAETYKIIKDLFVKAYGEKSEDGKRFNKSPEIADAFVHSLAFDTLFTEIITNEEALTEFFNKLIPTPPADGSSIPAPALK